MRATVVQLEMQGGLVKCVSRAKQTRAAVKLENIVLEQHYDFTILFNKIIIHILLSICR